MDINKKSLIDFLKLMAVKGEVENKELILNIDNNIEARTITPLKSVSVYGTLKTDKIEKDEYGIGNLKLFINLLNLCSSEVVEINRDNNKLKIISPDKNLIISYILTDVKYIKNSLDKTSFNSILKKVEGNEFLLPLSIIQYIISCCSVLGNDNLIIESDGKVLRFSLENNENEILTTIPLPEDSKIEEFKVKVGHLFIDILSSLNQDVLVSMKDNEPIMITVNNDNYKIIYLIAQLKK